MNSDALEDMPGNVPWSRAERDAERVEARRHAALHAALQLPTHDARDSAGVLHDARLFLAFLNGERDARTMPGLGSLGADLKPVG